MLADQLRQAGFVGVEVAGPGRVFARAEGPDSPEFLAEARDGGWRFSLTHAVRVGKLAMDEWNARNPAARIDVDTGETRLTLDLPPEPSAADLILWAGLAESFVQHALAWRRARRAAGEGM